MVDIMTKMALITDFSAFDDSYYDAQIGLFPCKALNNDENEFFETEKLVNNEIVLTEVDDHSCAVYQTNAENWFERKLEE